MVRIAQLVEQRTENPRVTSSNLVPGTEKGSTEQVLIQITRDGLGYIFENNIDGV